jgi:hypothetical protein
LISFHVGIDEFGASRHGELGFDLLQFLPHDGKHTGAAAENFQIFGDRSTQFLDLVGEFVTAQRGEALQADFQNRFRLLFRKSDGAISGNAVARICHQRDQWRHIFGRPVARHQIGFCSSGIGCGADQRNHFVDVGHRNGEPDQYMRPVARLAQLEARAARHHLFAENHKGADHVLKVHQDRTAGIQRQHVDAECRLQLRITEQLVEHDVAGRIAAQLDHQPHAVAVAFVADVADAFHPLVAHELGDALLQLRFVHLIRQFGGDNGFAILAYFLHVAARAHENGAAPAGERPPRGLLADDQRAGGEIRPRHDLRQRFQINRRVFDISEAGIDHLVQIMRRHVGCHTYSDTASTVHKQIGKAGRKHNRLAFAAVVVIAEFNGIPVKVFAERVRDFGPANFRITHLSWAIAVHRTKIALPVD